MRRSKVQLWADMERDLSEQARYTEDDLKKNVILPIFRAIKRLSSVPAPGMNKVDGVVERGHEDCLERLA